MDGGELPVGVALAADASNEIRALETALAAAGAQALILRHGLGHKVVALDIQLAREAHGARAGVGVVGVVLDLHKLALSRGVVVDYELYRAQHGHGARRVGVQILAQTVLQELYSTVLGTFATPMRSQKLLTAEAV